MLVYHDDIPLGTTVTNVYDTTIVIDQLPTTFVTSGEEVTFVSPDVDTDTWAAYKSGTPSENQNQYDDDTYWPLDGSRYGLDPQHAQANGSFFIDCQSGCLLYTSPSPRD